MKATEGIPKGRLIVYGLLFVFGAAYLLWAIFKKPAPSTEKFEQTKPAINVAKVAGPVLKVPIRILPKEAVVKKLPSVVLKPEEEVVNTGKITPAPYGGTTVDTIDTTTGEVKEQFKPNAAPWFSFEDKNYIGAGYNISNQGATVPVYWKRDVFQIKELHFQTNIGLKIPVEPSARFEWNAGANVEYRFNGFNPFK